MAALWEFGQEEMLLIEKLAHQRGFADPADYIRALIERDAVEHDESVAEGISSTVYASFLQGFKQALRGEGRPVREVMAELDGDE